MERHETVIIGGGQAGLAMSYHLGQRGREHVLLERDQLGGRWRSERWDSLHYQFPNWSLRLPGHSYDGDDPEGFCHYSKVIDFLADYARKVDPPARLGVDVRSVRRDNGALIVETDGGAIAAQNVVVATGAFPAPRIPDFASKLARSIRQLHSAAYRSPGQLPPGAVLVVGTGSSGGQIAEELQRAGREVLLSVSRHRRVPRRFLGKDMLWWFFELAGWTEPSTATRIASRRPRFYSVESMAGTISMSGGSAQTEWLYWGGPSTAAGRTSPWPTISTSCSTTPTKLASNSFRPQAS
jgi:putative flavoprotein involved in K+ transport